MVKVFIDAGHGGSDVGAVANGLREKDLTLKIAKKIRNRLNKYSGVSVKMNRTGDSYLSLSIFARLDKEGYESPVWSMFALSTLYLLSRLRLLLGILVVIYYFLIIFVI